MDVVRPTAAVDDEASTDESASDLDLDLTPRIPPASRAPRRDRRGNNQTEGRKWPWIVVLLLIVAAIGFTVSRAITDATLFFYNADEAVAKQPEIGVRRFRLQGTVVAGTTRRTADGVSFVVDFNGVDVNVNHVGDPPDLFQDRIPVVLEGRFDSAQKGAAFASDRILVKHSENYDAKNPDRIKEAEQGRSPGSPGNAPAGNAPGKP